MNPTSTDNFPWELISSSFCGNLSKKEEFRLQQWLTSDPGNKEKYRQLQEIWYSGMEDYKLYQMANEAKAWNNLHAKLIDKEETRVINFKTGKTHRKIYQIAAAAAIFLLIVGVGYWYTSLRTNTLTYETALNEQKSIKLTDGTSIALNPATKIEVAQGYNKQNRTVIMTSGEASFNIQHRSELPFIVDLGKVSIKDIGTIFSIKKDKELIKVNVISGTVAFIKQFTKETRELTAGMSLTYNILNESLDIIQTDNTASKVNNIRLDFDNTPLIDVIDRFQKKYGKTIKLEGDSIAHKKFTAHLDGIPYNTALNIVCKALNLEYEFKDNIYILREKAGR